MLLPLAAPCPPQSVGQQYLAQLVGAGRFSRAGEVCRLVFGADGALWEAQVFQLARLQQLRSLAPVLPRSGLSPTAYEMVLNEFLQLDPEVRRGLSALGLCCGCRDLGGPVECR